MYRYTRKNTGCYLTKSIEQFIRLTHWERLLWSGSHGTSLHLKSTARSLKADVILCSTCLSACSAAQRWEHALQIFNSLQDDSQGIWTGQSTEAGVWQNIKYEFCLYHLWSLDLRFGANLLREDALLQSDVVVYNSCISACGKGQQWQSAMILAMLYNRSNYCCMYCNAIAIDGTD